ncbi:M3 family metallopeptidase [Saccharicrinis sp. FJH2]|uniref:M3 family metallopeptidase n=1 Tax=Saccharicrinis sp. FJH65 TaxID=3344659 RepID=UPI0035F238B7
MKKQTLLLLLVLAVLSCKEKEMNPLLVKEFKTPHQTAPFDEIKNEDFMPAFEEAFKQGREEIDAIKNNADEPTFENTIAALDYAGSLLSRTSGVFYNLLSSETSDTLQEIAQILSPKMTAYHNDITLDEQLFGRVKAVYDKRNELELTTEQTKLLEDTYSGFARNGANLDEADKTKLRAINEELSKLSLDFNNHVLAETNAWTKLITNEEDLKGIPEGMKSILASKAKNEGHEGWLVDITMPVYVSVMKYADNRDLRHELYMAYGQKGFQDNDNNNEAIVKRLTRLRLERAHLLGYDTYADYVLVRRMAENPDNVYDLLNKLLAASLPAAEKEKAEVAAKAKVLGFKGELMPWDWSYYSEELKSEKFDLDDEMLKPYFKLENVISGVFGLATDLYGITFKENRDIQVYNPEVIPYEVYDQDGSFLAVLYADFHPRKGKRGGAWMNDFKGQWKKDGKDSRPHITIVMNFTPSTDDTPSLLTYDEVETFLHEFGHSLHGMFASTTYPGLSGTNVFQDFVELPSQIMENWGPEKQFLDKFAVHYKTGEPIPAELVQKIVDSRNFNAGYQSVRQLSFGLLDMAWHTLKQPYDGNVKEFEEQAWAPTRLFPEIDGVCMSTQFGHLFAGGYAAGYYGYKWAEVLDADAFSLFREKGIFNKDVATSFRKNILEKGGTENAMVLYKRFRGQEPSIDALLIRSGLKSAS